MSWGPSVKYMVTNNFGLIGETAIGLNCVGMRGGTGVFWDFRLWANAIYQNDTPVRGLYWFVGGGSSIGEANDYNWNRC